MGFFRKLFGNDEKKKSQGYVDATGLYFYFRCDHCGTRVRVRADKQHDLLSEGDGYVWHKTIVDSKCFRRMQTVVYLDRHYNVVNYELSGGRLLTQTEYEAAEAAAIEAAVEQVDEASDGAQEANEAL